MLKQLWFVVVMGVFISAPMALFSGTALAYDGELSQLAQNGKKTSKKKRKKKAKKVLSKVFSYGNHCGADAVSKKKPVDMVDALCQKHKSCCKEKTVGDISGCQCKCDRALIKGAKKLRKSAKKRGLTIIQRNALKSLVDIYSRMGCYCKPQKICEDVPKCGTKGGLALACKWKKKCKKVGVTGRGGRCHKPVCKTEKVCHKVMGKKICKNGVKCRTPKSLKKATQK